jgi:spermidine/putrescine transport system permease protein
VKTTRFHPISVAALVLYFFLYLPLVVVICESFNRARFGVHWEGFTLQWYRNALTDEDVRSALRTTLILAFSSTSVATVLGTLMGYGLARHQFPAKKLSKQLLLLPIAVPDIVMAVSLLLFYALMRAWMGIFNLGVATMAVAHITFQVPFVALIIQARLKGLDPALEEAASDLGASRWQRLWHVTLPLLRPGIMAGALLAFTLSVDDFVVSLFTSGAGSSTIPIYIYGSVKRGLTPEIHALASLLIGAAVLGTIGVFYFQNRSAAARGGAEREPEAVPL